MKKILCANLVTFALVFFASQAVYAMSLEVFTFSGTIDRTTFDPSIHYFDSGISPAVGDRFVGSLTYLFDPSIQSNPSVLYYESQYDVQNNSTETRYWINDYYSYTVSFKDFNLQESKLQEVITTNGETSDNLQFHAPEGQNHYLSTGEEMEDVSINFSSSTGRAFDGYQVPLSIISSEFDSGYMHLNFLSGAHSIDTGTALSPMLMYIGGKIDKIDTVTYPAPVPEPATMILLGTGLAGIVGTRLRKRKSIKI